MLKVPFIDYIFYLTKEVKHCWCMSNMLTAQKMKFSIKDFSSNVTKYAGNRGFGHIY